eukprot:gnl/MRDRNA2_/MRDRNA2_75399_c0_seq1.p1 gnl/MRDRNA2_/MRDRNA2_75399_c0~~gnl/MRDRNA2_/MRDRNA2_75399_c0_seq1.p1  ORF type:complete len:154 (+),score=23.35 gnl/MRDRNA2_/MRDRNA2_75399_c0_seq1:93-554(+)
MSKSLLISCCLGLITNSECLSHDKVKARQFPAPGTESFVSDNGAACYEPQEGQLPGTLEKVLMAHKLNPLPLYSKSKIDSVSCEQRGYHYMPMKHPCFPHQAKVAWSNSKDMWNHVAQRQHMFETEFPWNKDLDLTKIMMAGGCAGTEVLASR